MKYAVIITYTTGQQTGATVKAESRGQAWAKLSYEGILENAARVEIAEILVSGMETK